MNICKCILACVIVSFNTFAMLPSAEMNRTLQKHDLVQASSYENRMQIEVCDTMVCNCSNAESVLNEAFQKISKAAEQKKLIGITFRCQALENKQNLVANFICRIDNIGLAGLINKIEGIIPANVELLNNLRKIRLLGDGKSSEVNFFSDVSKLHYLEEVTIKFTYSFSEQLLRQIGSLDNLVRLEFCACKLKKMLDVFGQLGSLQKVNFSQNYLSTEDFKRILKAKNLVRIDLWKNNIDEIPEEIGELLQLQNLHLDHNKIKNIPACLASCVILKNLSLLKNPIMSVSSELQSLKKLDYVVVSEEIKRLFSGKWSYLYESASSGNIYFQSAAKISQ